MLIVGWEGCGKPHPTSLTQDEQSTLWTESGLHRQAGSDEAALTILHKEENVGLLIKHEPECLWIGHAGKKSVLDGFGRHGRIMTTFGRFRSCISEWKGVSLLS